MPNENRIENSETISTSEEDELKRIRLKKMKEIVKENKQPSIASNYPDAPVKVSDNNLKEFLNQYPTIVVDCWAAWCGPCRMVAPIIDDLAKDYSGKIVFGKLNVDENQRTAMQFGIMNIPTLLIFKNGIEVDRLVGAMPKKHLESLLTKYL
ncbi:MAG: thioredoxin 1 [Thermoproteota archaeon]|nr:thioredoxin 1 [Thermoproteota archaeon]